MRSPEASLRTWLLQAHSTVEKMRQLLKIQNVVPENSIIADHLRQNLSADWQEILKSCEADYIQHSFSPLDYALGELASLARSEGLYHSAF